MPKQRIKWIDLTKAIVFILVIIGHRTKVGTPIRNFIFSFHMPLFFVLSGYTFKIKTKFIDILTGGGRDLKKIYIPTIIAVFLQQAVACIKYKNYDIVNSIKICIKKILWGNGCAYKLHNKQMLGIGVVWFLIALILIKFLYNLICYILDNKKTYTKEFLLKITPLFLLISFIGITLGKKVSNVYYQSLDIVFVSLIFFHVGILLKEIDFFEIEDIKIDIIIWICGFLWFLFLEKGMYIELAVRRYHMGIISVLIAIISSCIVIKICKLFENFKISDYISKYIGENTLYLLVIHHLDGLLFPSQNWKYGFVIIFDLCILQIWLLLKKYLLRIK